MLVSFDSFTPIPRFDDIPWSTILIYESVAEGGPWTLIDTLAISPIDVDPSQPAERSFSTDNGTLTAGWYRITFKDVEGNLSPAEPIQNVTNEIMASMDDINANLDFEFIKADSNNTALLQISVARVIRANLGQIIDPVTLYSWTNPDLTPEIIREIAGKLIASQLYMEKVSRSSTIVPQDHYAQILYNQAMALLQQVIAGTILIPGVSTTPTDNITTADFFPVDATDRAFTLGMNL